MNNLSNYIIEKLHINKDINIKEKEYIYITDKYEVGDRCLYLSESGFKSQEKVLMEVVEITGRSKTKISYKFLTNINSSMTVGSIQKTSKEVTIGKIFSQVEQYMVDSGWSTTKMVISQKDSLDIFNKIIKNNKKADIYSIMFGTKSNGTHEVEVKQKKKDAIDNEYHSFEKISDENLELIKSKL